VLDVADWGGAVLTTVNHQSFQKIGGMIMKRMLIAFGLVLVGVTVLASGNGKRTILIDNFNDGDSEGWTERDFTAFTGEPRGSFDASSGKYVLETIEPIPIDDASVGTIDADWEASEENALFGNGTMRGTIRANTDGTTIGFGMRENHEVETAYGFYGSTSFGTFYIERFSLFDPEAPGQTIIAMADPEEHPFEVGKTYILEASVIGSKLTLKAWEKGDREPRRPILKLRHSEFGPESGTGLAALTFFDPVPLLAAGVEEVVVSATVDNLTFTPAKVNRRSEHDDDDDDEEDDDD
jgi:hypothetical protein